jgi:hypothetical protein
VVSTDAAFGAALDDARARRHGHPRCRRGRTLPRAPVPPNSAALPTSSTRPVWLPRHRPRDARHDRKVGPRATLCITAIGDPGRGGRSQHDAALRVPPRPPLYGRSGGSAKAGSRLAFAAGVGLESPLAAHVCGSG